MVDFIRLRGRKYATFAESIYIISTILSASISDVIIFS